MTIDEPLLRWRIGRVEVIRVTESVTPVPAAYLIPDVTPQHIADQQPWIGPFFGEEDALLLSVHSFVVVSGAATIVVDTCAGMHEGRRLEGDPTFLDRLSEAIPGGVDAVDVVVCTHLHFDHIGWNTIRDAVGTLVPAFPNARYLVTSDELDGFDRRDEEGLARAGLDPLVEAKVLDPVSLDHRITADVRLLSTPGHTPGHVSIVIDSEGASGLITGDATHSPIQFAYPELATTRVDHDSDASRRTRRELIADFADTDTLVLGTHFAPPTAGWLRGRGDGTAWFATGDATRDTPADRR